jgi:RNA recognition motif-containing protein
VSTTRPANNGDNDASPDSTPSQFLLFRGLEPSVTEELFAKGVAKLNKPTDFNASATPAAARKFAKVASTTGDANLGARDGALRRVMIVRDRRTNESWRYGFAEYATIEDAQAAVTRYNSFDRFTIASKHVLVSYIHAGVFVPVHNPSASVQRFLFSPTGNTTLKLAYWDEDAYVTQLVINMPDPEPIEDISKRSKTTVADGSRATKDGEKAKKRKAAVDVGESSTKKPAPSHLQFWSNRHAELHGIKRPGSRAGSEKSNDETLVAPLQSFADETKLCCWLCMRQFKTVEEVRLHERASKLHGHNLKLSSRLQKALHKLEKHGLKILPLSAESSGEYRDRARERRKVYGVVNKKGEQISRSGGKRPIKSGSASANSSDVEPTPVPSKGAALLSKMGYTPGAGLGAQGDGMRAPISQDVYVAGVGLGAQGGKVGNAIEEAEKRTKGSSYQDFVDSAKQGARERYERMG